MPREINHPSVFHLATTTMADDVDDFLEHLGASDWTSDATDDAGFLTELAGRSCYRSFGAGLNRNVTRVREGNENYVGSILESGHGSVLEHACDTFAICDVSRVVTHELVRHRAGTAFSQESGRYVRVDDMGYYFPSALRDDFLRLVYDDMKESVPYTLVEFDEWAENVRDYFRTGMKMSEKYVTGMEKMLGLDHLKSFDRKKKLQSSIRRIAPNGMTTMIVITANQRAWRHLTSMRTNGAAEEEIRLVQWMIFQKLMDIHPTIYQDAVIDYETDVLPGNVPVVSFKSGKV